MRWYSTHAYTCSTITITCTWTTGVLVNHRPIYTQRTPCMTSSCAVGTFGLERRLGYTRVISSTIISLNHEQNVYMYVCGILPCMHITPLHHVTLPLHEVSESKTDLDQIKHDSSLSSRLAKRIRSAHYRLGCFFCPRSAYSSSTVREV